MHLFYSRDIQSGKIYLPEDESLHAVKVLRLGVGVEVGCMDGVGNFYECKLSNAHSKKCELTVLRHQKFERTRNKKIHIAIAPTKNSDRIEWFVEKAVEIGIDKISFIHCEHSERKSMNMDRTERVALAALKQSQQYFVPQMEDMVKFSNFVEQYQRPKNGYIAHLEEGMRYKFSEEVKDKDDVLILVGPEGDFSKAEVDLAVSKGFKPVMFGENRLRTETAGVYAVTVCSID